MALTEIQRANLRLGAANMSLSHGSKAQMEKDACLDMAQKIYNFAIGQEKAGNGLDHLTPAKSPMAR